VGLLQLYEASSWGTCYATRGDIENSKSRQGTVANSWSTWVELKLKIIPIIYCHRLKRIEKNSLTNSQSNCFLFVPKICRWRCLGAIERGFIYQPGEILVEVIPWELKNDKGVFDYFCGGRGLWVKLYFSLLCI